MAQAALSYAGLPEELTHNPLWTLMRPFMKSWTRVFHTAHVTAVRVQLELPNEEAYDLAVKYWPEDRISSCSDQVAAAARATTILDHQLLLPELSSCRVKRQGLVSISRYGGTNLEDLLKSPEFLNSMPTVKEQEGFLKQLVAHLLVALDHLYSMHELEGGPQSYRDLKPSNIVVNLDNMKASLIDFGFMIRKDCSDVFQGISDDHFPVDYTARDPNTEKPYCCDEVSGYKKAALAVADSRAGTIDSNMVGITALRVLSAFTPDRTELLTVQWKDYKPTDEEIEGFNKKQLEQLQQARLAAFAEDYQRFMSDRKALSQLLASTGISEAAVEFLLDLLEVDTNKRPSVRAAKSRPWLRDSVKEVKGQIVANTASYTEEQEQYEQLPMALQQAADQLSHQQQQQLDYKKPQQEEQQQFDTHQALLDAEMKLRSNQQCIEELKEQVLMLQNKLLETKTELQEADDLLQAAEDQLAEMFQIYEEQVPLIDLPEQQLLSQQQLNQQLQQDAVMADIEQQIVVEQLVVEQQQQNRKGGDGPHQQRAAAGDQQHQAPVNEGAEALLSEEFNAVLVQQQPAIYCNEVYAADVGEKASDSSSTNSSIGGSVSSDLSAPHTPFFSSDGSDPFGSSSLTAAAWQPDMKNQDSCPTLSSNAQQTSTAVAANMATINSNMATVDAVLALVQPRAAAAVAAEDSTAIRVIDSSSTDGSIGGGSSSECLISKAVIKQKQLYQASKKLQAVNADHSQLQQLCEQQGTQLGIMNQLLTMYCPAWRDSSQAAADAVSMSIQAVSAGSVTTAVSRQSSDEIQAAAKPLLGRWWGWLGTAAAPAIGNLQNSRTSDDNIAADISRGAAVADNIIDSLWNTWWEPSP